MSGAGLPKSIKDNPLIANWIGFDTDGVVRVRSGKVELGQGNATALQQIAADELDVGFDRISFIAGDTGETPNEGFTSGSHSIEVGGVAMRLAASAARAVLLREAATLLQAQFDALSVKDGAIYVGERKTDLTYWTLAPRVDLARPVRDFSAPKVPGARRLAGQSVARVDLPEKVRGGGFVHDFSPAGLVHGRVLHPPALSQRLRAIELDAARAIPGVLHVVRDGSYVGVIAEREEVAVQALEILRQSAVWTEPGESPGNIVDALLAREGTGEVVHSAGDPQDRDGRVISTRVSRPYLFHASIAPSCAVAQMEGGRLTVWAHAQGSHPLRAAMADALEMTVDDIRIIHLDGAGCYGHNGADDVALDAAVLARHYPGAPIRVLWSRADEFASSPLGPAMVTDGEAVLGDNGRIKTLTVDVRSAPHGQRPGRNGFPNLLAAEYLEKAHPVLSDGDVTAGSGGGADRNGIPYYDVANSKVIKRVMFDLPYRTSSMRGLGAFLNVYAIETLMDDVAHDLGVDAIKLRLDHLSDARAREVITRTAEMAGWPGTPGDGVGYGFGFARYKNTAAYCAVCVRVEVEEAVRVTHAWSALDAGEIINPDGAINQTEGGIIQAASWTLKEGVAFDGEAVASLDWEAYPILTFSEVPEIDVDLIIRPELAPEGLAEGAAGPTAAAIGNAVRNALGIRVRNLPITRDAIIAAMELEKRS